MRWDEIIFVLSLALLCAVIIWKRTDPPKNDDGAKDVPETAPKKSDEPERVRFMSVPPVTMFERTT